MKPGCYLCQMGDPHDVHQTAAQWFGMPGPDPDAARLAESACCTLAPGHDGPCVWDCSNCSGTGDCPDCADALVIFDPCSTCRDTGGCQVCNKAGQFVDALPEPRPVVTVELNGVLA